LDSNPKQGKVMSAGSSNSLSLTGPACRALAACGAVESMAFVFAILALVQSRPNAPALLRDGEFDGQRASTLSVGLEPLSLSPSLSRPLTGPLVESGSCHSVEVGSPPTQAPLPAPPTHATAFGDPTAGRSFLPASAVTVPALDTRALSDPRSRPLPFVSSPFAHAVAAIHVFPLLAVKPLRRPSRPQLLFNVLTRVLGTSWWATVAPAAAANPRNPRR